MQRPDHHNEIQLNMLCRGRVTYLLGGSTVRVKVGQLTAFWAAIPHQIIDYEADTEYFVATMPLAWFLQCQLPDLLVRRACGCTPRAYRVEHEASDKE